MYFVRKSKGLLQKEKTLEIIAEDFDKPLNNVERICAAVMQCGLNADPQEIFDEMESMAPIQ